MDALTYLIYGVPCAALFAWQMARRRRLEKRSAAVKDTTGAAEPASLHPVIDPARCIGCASCLKACPEQELHTVLGLVGGRAELVSPGDCIGHGACRTACPVNAITLVFGSERRGVDIPLVTPHFESTVPGMFIAGELGGMGLIRNALEQGRQAVETIAQRRSPGGAELLDLVIVGAGPAGFAAALTAKSKNMRCVTLEQESLGGAVFQYPRGKLVMTAPATVPLIGKVNFRQTSKEALLEFWQDAEKKTGIKINYRERVEDIARAAHGFTVRSSLATYEARNVLLAIGRRELPASSASRARRCPRSSTGSSTRSSTRDGRCWSSVAATAPSRPRPASPSAAAAWCCLTGAEFDRAKARNRERVQNAVRDGQLLLLMKSNVKHIEPRSVVLEHAGEMIQVENDAVIVSAGGVLPSEFLKRVGIAVETKYGVA